MAEDVLDSIYQEYLACPRCHPEPAWDKSAPLSALPYDIQEDTMLCPVCGRRPLDAVMGHILSVMMVHGDRSGAACLTDAGTPLIERGFPIMYPPRLGPQSLVLISDDIGAETAQDIVNRVPEVKGVMLRSGSQSAGIKDTSSTPHQYMLLAGCDMRCDMVQTTFGELVVYKSQSKIHIEFPKENSYKMGVLDRLDGKGMLAGSVVVDGMCGPGTLGLMVMLSGADRVIFNDAWRPAIENLLLNLQVNRDLLDIELEMVSSSEDLPLVGDGPVLVAKARRRGKTAAEIYFGDLRLLAEEIKTCDLCLIDTFPSQDPSDFVNIWSSIAYSVIVI